MPAIFSPVVISRSKCLRLVKVQCIVQVAHVISPSESGVFDIWTRLPTFRCGIRKLGQVLFFAKTSGIVTGDKEKNWPIAERRVLGNDPRSPCKS